MIVECEKKIWQNGEVMRKEWEEEEKGRKKTLEQKWILKLEKTEKTFCQQQNSGQLKNEIRLAVIKGEKAKRINGKQEKV